MIFIPRGFASKLRVKPLATWILVVLNVGYYAYHPNITTDAFVEIIQKIFSRPEMNTESPNPHFVEFCDKTLLSSNVCDDVYSDFQKHIVSQKNPDEIMKTVSRDIHLTLFMNHFFDSKLSEFSSIVEDVHKKYHIFSSYNFTLSALLISQFTHSGLMHLIGNMVVLVLLGIWVEQRIGAAKLIVFYILGGCAGFLMNDLSRGIVGASAGVSVIIGLSLIFFYRMRIKVSMFSPPFLWGHTAMIPMWAFVVLGFLITDLQGLLLGESHVAHRAHLGGLFCGIIFGYITKHMQKLATYHLHPLDKSDYQSAKTHWHQKSFTPNDVLLLCETGLAFNRENLDFKNLKLNVLLDLNSIGEIIPLAKEVLLDSIRHKKLKNNFYTVSWLFQNGLLDDVIVTLPPKKVKLLYEQAFLNGHSHMCILMVEKLTKTFPFNPVTIELKNSLQKTGGLNEHRS